MMLRRSVTMTDRHGSFLAYPERVVLKSDMYDRIGLVLQGMYRRRLVLDVEQPT